MDFTFKKSITNPREKTNPISVVFYWWLFPLLRTGSKRELGVNDLYDVLKDDEANKLGHQLSIAWDEECLKAKQSGRRPKLLNALIRVFFLPYLICPLTILVAECVVRVGQTVFLHQLIISFNEESSVSDQYLLGTGVILTSFLYVIMLHTPVFGIFHVGMRIRIAACSIVYRKALRLSKAAQGQTTTGQLVNIMSNDVNRFDTNFIFLHYLIIGPLQLAILVYLLWTEGDFGYSSVAGAIFLVLLVPFQYINSRLVAKFRLATANRTDKRGQIMNEIILAMRVIKMYAWEKPFAGIVDELRRSEVKILKKTSILRGIYMSLYISASKLVAFLVIIVFLLTGGELKASNVFFLVSASNIVRLTMVYMIPNGAAHIGELRVSMQRIEDYLQLDEMKPTAMAAILPSVTGEDIKSKPGSDASVSLINAYASWTKDRVTMDDVTLNLRGEKLVMVVGPVGSGKTSFLHALISELPISKGKCVVTGRTSYAAQEPWIFAGNIRQNILFGRDYDSSRYRDVVEVSALEDDLKQLPYGENTIVGERGTALSGGQKARVNLARALYQQSDIYLLDDPLSAVDARVSRHIFEKCVQGYLKDKLRILVTHQLQYLPRADHIVILSRGKVAAQGTYIDLIQQGIDFLSLMTDEDEENKGRKRADSVSSEKAVEVPNAEVDDDEPEKKDEKMAGGHVTAGTYWEYFQSGGSTFAVIMITIGYLATQTLYSFADYWLSYWTRMAEAGKCNDDYNSSSTTMAYDDVTFEPCEEFDHNFYFYVYTGIVVGVFIATKGTAISFFVYCMKISINVHDRMFRSMVRAPTKFYDDNPSGRIMNRFTKDIGSMDELMPPAFYDAVSYFLLMVGSLGLVIASNYVLVVPSFFLFVILIFMRKFYMKTARDVKRIEAMARSPIYTHLAATLQGLTTIRSSGSEDILIKQFDGHQDVHSSAWYIFLASSRWFGIWLEMVSIGFLIIVTYGFMVLAGFQDFDGSQVGLAISSCLGLTGTFQWGMRQSAETENLMTSVERALEYSKLKPEAPLESTQDKKPPKDWPKSGSVRFEKVSLAYEDTDVLKNLSFEMKDKEKIGIVGRTGAGKSTIIAALFRMTEPRGDVFIDNIRINDIGLHDLRMNVSIIPQDPVLFSGTVRYNLDPFDQFQDDELWQVIEDVELKDAVPALDFKVSDGGGNFSVGQRQLVCLARAILRKNRILIMDEATANVDPKTDSFIQSTIRTKFADCSIITIAHRLHSVMDCDKILVLDQGVLIEYDHPYVLLQSSNGILASMVSHTGSGTSLILRQVAKDSWRRAQNGLGSFSVDNISLISKASAHDKDSVKIDETLSTKFPKIDSGDSNSSGSLSDPIGIDHQESDVREIDSPPSDVDEARSAGSDVDEAGSAGSDVDEAGSAGSDVDEAGSAGSDVDEAQSIGSDVDEVSVA